MNSGFPLGQIPETGISWKGSSSARALQSFLGQSCLGDGEVWDKENPSFSEGARMPWDAGLASQKAEDAAFVCSHGPQDLTFVFQPGNLEFCFICAIFDLGVPHRKVAIFAEALELAGRESIAAPSLAFLEKQTANLFISQLWACLYPSSETSKPHSSFELPFHFIAFSYPHEASQIYGIVKDICFCSVIIIAFPVFLLQVALLCVSHAKKGQVGCLQTTLWGCLIKVSFRFNRAPEKKINVITWYCPTLHWRSGKDEQDCQRDSPH